MSPAEEAVSSLGLRVGSSLLPSTPPVVTREWLPVKTGVPQESILHPTLFIVHINSLASVISLEPGDPYASLYADDTALLHRARRGV